jgi:DNA-binding ferritin-like protein
MTVCQLSPVMDFPTVGEADDLLSDVLDAVSDMIDQYHALNDAAEEVNYIDISNFAQDQIGQLSKLRWMIEATLEVEND